MDSRRRKKLSRLLARVRGERCEPEAIDLLRQATKAAGQLDRDHVGKYVLKALKANSDHELGQEFDERMDKVTDAWLGASGGRLREPQPREVTVGRSRSPKMNEGSHQPRRRLRAEVFFCSTGGVSMMEVSSVGRLRSFLPPTGGLIIVVQDPEAAPLAKSIVGDSVPGVESHSPMA